MYNSSIGVEFMKRRVSALLIAMAAVLLLFGCEAFTWPAIFPTIYPVTTKTTRTIDISGTISIGLDDYQTYSRYHSSAYDLIVDQYNDILINTRDRIRRANIGVQTSLYKSRTLYPFGTTTVLESVNKGSGFIYKEDDDYFYAVTNFHVVDPKEYTPAYEIMTFEDSDYHEAELIAYDESLDLAILRFLKNERTEVVLLDIAERSFTKFNPGELVLAVGNPLSVTDNVTFGEYVNLVRLDDVQFLVIYHTAMIHEGSSGGAVVDVDGNLLGVNTWGTDGNDEVSYAVPVSILYMFLHNNDLLP